MIKLKELQIEEAERIAELANDSSIAINLPQDFPHPYTKNHAVNWIERTKNTKRGFGIYLETELIGMINYELVEPWNAYLAFWIGKEYRNLGAATKSVESIIPIIFKQPHIQKITIAIKHPNPASERIAIKNGFKKEGQIRKIVMKNNQLHDLIIYGLLRKEA